MEAVNTSMVVMPHPILAAAGREAITEPFRGGETIAEYLERNAITLDFPCLLSLDGVVIPPERWEIVCPREGQLIEVRAVPQGGDGSDARRAILTIVVMAVAAYSGGLFVNAAGNWTAASYAASAAVTYAGMALVNQIAPLPDPDLSESQGDSDASPTYSLSGGRNKARPYEPLPLLYGTHRMWPDLGAKTFTEFAGNDQYLYLALNFGLGELVVDSSSYKIGDTPLDNFNGVEVYESGTDGAIQNFPGNVDSISGDDLTAEVGWITRTTSADTTRIAVDLAGQLFYSSDEGSTTRSAEFAMEYRKIDGPVTSLHNWQTYGTTTTYSGFWSLGYEDNRGIWQQIRYRADPYDAHEDYEYFTQIYITVYDQYSGEFVNQLVNLYWHWLLYEGNTYPAPPQVRTENPMIIHNGSQEPVRRSYYINRLPPGQYEVRVKRVTPDETDDLAISLFSWSALRSYQIDPGDYTGQTRLGLRIKASAQLNGQMDKFNAMVSRRVFVWNGTDWVRKVSSNPAYIFLDFARGAFTDDGKRIYGAGLEYSEIDLDLIKEWAAFCDDNNLTFNGVFDRKMTAAKVLDAIAACGRASRSMGTGKLGVVWEEANAPAVAMFGMSNIKSGSFNVDYISESLADEVEVSFVNGENGYRPDTVRASSPGVTNPTRTKKIDYFGCTDPDMAGRFANLAAARNVYWRRRITWQTDAEGLVVQKGEVAMLSHDLTQWGYSGRLVSGTATTLVLDSPVPFSAGESHYITLRRPNGTMSTHAVVLDSGEQETLSIAGDPLPIAPDDSRPIDWLWLFAPKATPGKRVKIVDIKPVDENTVRLTATDDDPSYYAAESSNYTYIPPETNSFLTPKITNIDIAEDELGYSGLSRVHFVFDTEGAVAWLNLQISYNNGPWQPLGKLEGRSLSLDLKYRTSLRIWAQPVSVVTTSAPTNATADYLVQGVEGDMQDVPGFSVSASGGFAIATWDRHPLRSVTDGGYIRIRHTSKTSNQSWSDGIDVGPTIPGNNTSAMLPLLTGTYMARAVDAFGNMSPGTSMAVTTVPSIMNYNAVDVADEAAAGFTGNKTNLVYIEGALRLSGTANIDDMTTNIDDWPYIDSLGGIHASGEYLFADTLDLGAVYSSRVTANISALAFDANDLIDERDYIDNWPSVDGDNVDDAGVSLFIRTTEDDPAGSPTWSDWKPFSIGDYLARGIEHKLVFTSGNSNHNVSVDGLSVLVDMPDRMEGERGVTVPDTGLSISYPSAFRAAPALGVTILNTQNGDVINITNETESGANIAITNGGFGVERTINWMAKGYGQQA